MSLRSGVFWFAALAASAVGCHDSPGTGRTGNPQDIGEEAGTTFTVEPQEAGVPAAFSTQPGPTESPITQPSPPADADVPSAALDAGPERTVLWGLQPGSVSPDAGVVEQAWAGAEITAFGSRILTYVSRQAEDDFVALAMLPEMNWVVTLAFETWLGMDDAQLATWIDRAWGLGPVVRYLVIGQHLESDLFALPDEEQTRVVARLATTLDLARSHEAKPSEAAVGLGVVTMTVLPTTLLGKSDFIALSFTGLAPDGSVSAPQEAFTNLEGRIEQVNERHGPVIVQDLAYPSINGEADQQAFFGSVRQWFEGPNLPAVLAVVVSSLYSPGATDCEVWAADWQFQGAEEVCGSVGLRDSKGAPKPALNEVTELLAQFAQL